jgi:hypothetical protein
MRSIAPTVLAITLSLTPLRYAAAQAFPPGADAFLASANALAKSANERVELGRANARLNQIRLSLTQQLVTVANGNAAFSLSDLDETKLLCGVQSAHIEVASRRNYMQTVAGRIEEVGKTTQIDNLIGAIESLFAHQSIDLRGPMASRQEMETFAKNTLARCSNDIKSSQKSYYLASITAPVPVPTASNVDDDEFALAFFGPLNSLINAFVGIITPAVVEGAKLIDERERRAAIRRFLSDETNRNYIRQSGDTLATQVGLWIEAKRGKLTGSFLEKLAILRKTEVNLAKLDACKGFEAARFNTRASGAASDEFALCWRAAWGQLEASVTAFLKAADEYDPLLDAGDKNNAKTSFAELTEALSAISENSVTNPEALWAIATRLVSIGEKIQAATSKESREKIHKAIDDLVKALS